MRGNYFSKIETLRRHRDADLTYVGFATSTAAASTCADMSSTLGLLFHLPQLAVALIRRVGDSGFDDLEAHAVRREQGIDCSDLLFFKGWSGYGTLKTKILRMKNSIIDNNFVELTRQVGYEAHGAGPPPNAGRPASSHIGQAVLAFFTEMLVFER